MMRKSVIQDNKLELMIDHGIYVKLKQRIEEKERLLRILVGRLQHKCVQTDGEERTCLETDTDDLHEGSGASSSLENCSSHL